MTVQKRSRVRYSLYYYLNLLNTKSNNFIIQIGFFFNLQRAPVADMTKTQAKTWCENYMNNSPSFLACKDVPNINSARAVEICVMDIIVSELNFYTIYRYIAILFVNKFY